MQKPAEPANEIKRIKSLEALKILDTPFDESYDRITRLAQAIFSVPIALVSLVDTNRQWFKSCVGLPVRETGRDISFCGHAILEKEPFIIPDASEDERFADNPLVTEAPNIRFYAGRPLVTLDGNAIGTLCIIDQIPRQLSPADIIKLHDLASMVEKELHNRELAFKIDETQRELMAAKEKAEMANQEKSRFLANMSHELRTPMHSIMSFSSMGEKKTREEKSQRYFNNIGISAQRLLRLIDDLLDISKLECGRIEVDFNYADLVPLIKEQINVLSALAEKKSIQVEYQGIDSATCIFDRKLMTQLVVNYLSNAIKYSAGNTSIVVSCDITNEMHKGQLQDCVRCSVRDKGIGIPVSEQDHIFDRFYESTQTRNSAGGTGLGLAICKEIAQLHSGITWVESPPREQHNGSEFYWRIPINPEEMSADVEDEILYRSEQLFVSQHEDLITFNVKGRFDSQLSDEFDAIVRKLPKNKTVELSMSDCDALYSDGLGAIIRLIHHVKQAKHNVRIINCGPVVKDTLTIMNLNKLCYVE